MVTIPIFVITLEHRKDRQETVKSTLDLAGVDYQFIFSSRSEQEKNFQAMSKITAIEVAIWDSHVKAMLEMLKTESQWALIFEDDFILRPRGLALLENNEILDSLIESVSGQYSIFQIGFLENSQSSKHSYFLAKTFKLIFRYNRFDLRSLINNFRFLGFKNGDKMNKSLKEIGFGATKVLFGLRLGLHAYLINREAASSLIEVFNSRSSNKNFTAIDHYLLKLTENFDNTSVICAGRLSNSFVGQSGSLSDNFDRTPVTVLEDKSKK